MQFVDEITGKPIGAPVLVAVADANPKNLELLLNNLQEHVGNLSFRDQSFKSYAEGLVPRAHGKIARRQLILILLTSGFL